MLRTDYMALAQSPEWDLVPEQMQALFLMERPHSLHVEGDLIKVRALDGSVWLPREQLDHLEAFRAVACVRSAA